MVSFFVAMKGELMQNKQEIGRSMVEILGVLAVMGLLGMAGVKMYTNAMNKHRANELIYEAQKRATMVAMQITSGQDRLSVIGFQDPVSYTFGVEKNPANANQFNITIIGVSTDVCTQMKSAIGDAATIRMISDDCSKLTFNNDLSHLTNSQCLASGKFWCPETNYCSTSADCCLGNGCVVDTCPSGTSTTGVGGNTGIFVNENSVNTECKCIVSEHVYTENGCTIQPASCHS